MKYTDFITAVKECVESKLNGSESEVRINKVFKVNDTELDGISIFNKNCLCSPTVYLNDFYDMHQSSSLSVEEAADIIIRINRENKDQIPYDMKMLDDFESARKHITYKLVNTALNSLVIKDAPHREIFDLSFLYYITVVTEGNGVYSSKITWQLMEKWNITEEILYELAEQNTRDILGVEIININDIIDMSSILNKDINKDISSIPMFIMSNRIRNCGANVMFYTDILNEFSKSLNSDLYIIPSSVHEVILLPADNYHNIDYMNKMIEQVNDQIDLPDILSDHIYLFSREEGIKWPKAS